MSNPASFNSNSICILSSMFYLPFIVRPVSSVQVGQFLQTAGWRFRLSCKAFLAWSDAVLCPISFGTFPCSPFQLSPALLFLYILDFSKGHIIVLLSNSSCFPLSSLLHQSRETIPRLTLRSGAFRLKIQIIQ